MTEVNYYQCNLCGETFPNETDLIRSFKKDGQKIRVDEPSFGPFHLCRDCVCSLAKMRWTGGNEG